MTRLTGSMTLPFGWQSRALLLHFFPLTENCRADANDGCAFFDRDFVIVRHAHRKLAARVAERSSRTEFVAQLAQLSKERPHLFRFVKERRQRHQSRQPQTLTLLQHLDYLRNLGFICARLRSFVTEIDLN